MHTVEGQLISVPFDGESMLPTLRPGDVLYVRPGAPLRFGAVYLLHDEKGPVAHRLVRHLSVPLFKGDRSLRIHAAHNGVWGEVVALDRGGKRKRLPSSKLFLAAKAWWSLFRY